MYEYQLTVRGYELDSYGHVNHAVYLNYLEQARWEIIREAGLIDQLLTEKKKLVVIKAEIRYMNEIRLFDPVIIQTKVKKEAPYLVFYHKMIIQKSNLKSARATVKTILLDENKIPVDIPEEMILSLELNK